MKSFEKFIADQMAEMDAVLDGKKPAEEPKPLYHQEFECECHGHGDYVDVEVNRLQNMAKAMARSKNPVLAKLARNQLAAEISRLVAPSAWIDYETSKQLAEIADKLSQ